MLFDLDFFISEEVSGKLLENCKQRALFFLKCTCYTVHKLMPNCYQSGEGLIK